MTYKELHKELKKKILKDYGKRCPDFAIECVVCQKYMALDILEDSVVNEDYKPKKK